MRRSVTRTFTERRTSVTRKNTTTPSAKGISSESAFASVVPSSRVACQSATAATQGVRRIVSAYQPK
jgi:hypothetical protein